MAWSVVQYRKCVQLLKVNVNMRTKFIADALEMNYKESRKLIAFACDFLGLKRVPGRANEYGKKEVRKGNKVDVNLRPTYKGKMISPKSTANK